MASSPLCTSPALSFCDFLTLSELLFSKQHYNPLPIHLVLNIYYNNICHKSDQVSVTPALSFSASKARVVGLAPKKRGRGRAIFAWRHLDSGFNHPWVSGNRSGGGALPKINWMLGSIRSTNDFHISRSCRLTVSFRTGSSDGMLNKSRVISLLPTLINDKFK